MPDKKERRKNGLPAKICGLLLGICLTVGLSTGVVQAAAENNRNLLNGSFEEGQTFTGSYSQPDQSAVPSWNTTAFEGKIELFRKNTGTYITNVTLAPTAGNYAAELNADEESTLYQNVKTTPSSVYKWGLDHGARTTMDTIALVIGPKQSVEPSKPSKDGRDQLMQMVDWLSKQYEERGLSLPIQTSTGENKCIIVYSKKFAASGTFEDNVGNNAFSLTPSTIYTEEWHIWIIQDSRATSGENPWGSYGSNTEKSAESTGENDSIELDLSKYYLYTVPAGQTETVFGFVSVGCEENKGKTYGNFLDNINFDLYHPLSGSSTIHGSVVIGGSDGTAGGVGATAGHKVTVGETYTTYITDNETLKIQAIVKAADAGTGCEFVGVYYTKQESGGNPETTFIQLSGKEIEDTGDLTDEQKEGKWLKSTNTDGEIIYTYYLKGLTSPADLHFVFIKNPTITYDPNGGKAYEVQRTYNTEEAANVYSFKPVAGSGYTFITPYVSHAAVGQNDDWKFMGWKLTGDTVETNPPRTDLVNTNQLGSLILPAVHTVACDYAISEGENTAQYFKMYEENPSLSESIIQSGSEVTGVTWTDGGATKVYANVHKGLTMVAQWRWRQAFIPQVGSGTNYTDSASGGTVEITSVTDPLNENYNAAFKTTGGKAYFAETNETVTAKATANPGFIFEGWYDKNGNLITTNATYSYSETKESVNTYFAHFSGSVTQTYIRQVKNGDIWEITGNNDIGILSSYSYTDVAGNRISSTAMAGNGYKFGGWYDSMGNKVADNMLANDGATLSYTTTGDATYYARFEKAYTVKFAAQTKQTDGHFATNMVGGEVSVASVTDVDGTAASSKATAHSGYRFLGWYDKDGYQLGTDAIYSTTTTSATDGVTYYARFEAVSYTIHFAAQTKQTDDSFVTDNVGGEVSATSVTNVDGTAASSNATAHLGYKFLGWYDGASTLLSTNATYSTTITSAIDDATCYARFSVVEYKVNYDLAGGSGSISDTQTYYHSNVDSTKSTIFVTETVPTKEGYVFNGWELVGSTNPVGASIKVDDYWNHADVVGDVTVGEGVFKLKAKWIEQAVTIDYVATPAGGGSVSRTSETVPVETGSVGGSTATASEGYHFEGWYDNEACSGDPVSIEAHYVPAKANATYYAKFSSKETVVIDVIGKTIEKTYDGNQQSINTGYDVTYTVNGVASTALPGGIRIELNLDDDKISGINANTYIGTLSQASFIVTNETAEYTVQLNVTPGKLTIHPKPVTVTLVAEDKVYDGTIGVAAANYALTVNGTVESDSVIATASSVTFADKNVSTGKTVTADGITLNNPNYTLVDNAGHATTQATATANITPATANVSVIFTDREYNGTASVDIAAVEVTSGKIPADDVSASYASGTKGTVSDINIGLNKTVTIPDPVLSGADKENYVLNVNLGKVTITPKAVIVKADDNRKVYGETDPTLTATVTGTIGSDTVHYTVDRAAGEDVGTYTITARGDEMQGNYKVTYQTGTFTITDRATSAQVRASGGSKVYDGTPLTVSAAVTGAEGYTILYKVGEGAWTNDAPKVTNVSDGTMRVSVMACKEGYEDLTLDNDVTISITPRPVTITVNNAEKSFGQPDPSFTGDITGGSLVNPNDLGTISYRRTNDAEAVGTYANVLTAEYAANSNYDVTVDKGGFTINLAPTGGAAVTASGGSKVYDGTPLTVSAAVTGAEGYTILYKVGEGDYVTNVPSVTNVSDGTMRVSVKACKEGCEDLTLDSDVTISITPRPVTITVNNAEKSFGQPDPSFTGDITGGSLVNPNDVGFISYHRTNDAETVGIYANVLTADFTANSNYDVTVDLGDFTIKSNVSDNPDTPDTPNVPDYPDDPDDSDDPDIPSKPPVVPVVPSKPELNADDHMAYIRGYADGTVRPNNFITRAQVATIFYRLMTDESRALFFSETNDYSDISADYWANQAISTLSGTGVLTGFTDGTFRPDAYITRAQFAAIAARFSTVTMGLRNPFSDVPQGYWAEDLIAFAAQIGWIDGYVDGSFHPDDHITRAAVMKLINNMLDRHVDAEGLPENVVHWSDCSPDDWYYYIVMEATNAHDHERRSKDSLLENWTLLTDDDPVQAG